jgi:S-DNA-T family DNA segregation ATPase FtsK/SpoIIIE
MGQSAVRSQMDLRVAFRVRERRDVDLILGQGMLAAGWLAHKLNAPGKFLISAPEYDTPRRARAYLVTDQAVSDAAAHYAGQRPELDEVSRRAIGSAPALGLVADPAGEGPAPVAGPPGPGAGQEMVTAEDTLWLALCVAPEAGTDVGELMAITAMTRATLYRRLAEHAKAGRAVQVSRGRWRAQMTQEPPHE